MELKISSVTHIDAGAGNSGNAASRRGAARRGPLRRLDARHRRQEDLEIELGRHTTRERPGAASIEPHRNRLEFSTGEKVEIPVRRYTRRAAAGTAWKYLNDPQALMTSISSA